MITLGESLGRVESLIYHTESMTHGAIPKELKEKVGTTGKLIRLSFGIEDLREALINGVKVASK